MRFTAMHRGADSQPFTVVIRDGMVEIVCARGSGYLRARCWFRAQCLSRLLRIALDMNARTVIVDLEGSGDANTPLLAVLIEARIHARRSGARLVMRGSPALHQLAEICRLEDVLSPHRSRVASTL